MFVDKIKNALIYLSNSHNKRDDNIWVFGEWFAKRCNDNACFFANNIIKHHPEIKAFWICERDTDTSLLDTKIEILDNGTEKAVEVLKKAGVAVVIQGINDFYNDGRNYLGNALKVNLWHGMMWKKLGYDIYGGPSAADKIRGWIRNNINRHYIFASPNRDYRRIIKGAFLINDKEIINAGFPRNSIFYDEKSLLKCREKIEGILDVAKTTKIITYMPTFRDNTSDVFSFKKMINNEKLMSLLNDWDAVIVEKSHFVNAQSAGEEKRGNDRILFLSDVSATELLGASDILITDYSSCFFDYLILDRPIIHYIYDYNYYVNKDRGLYFTKEEVACGQMPETIDDLLKSLELYLDAPETDRELRIRQKKRFWKYDSPDACDRIYRAIRDKQKKGR